MMKHLLSGKLHTGFSYRLRYPCIPVVIQTTTSFLFRIPSPTCGRVRKSTSCPRETSFPLSTKSMESRIAMTVHPCRVDYARQPSLVESGIVSVDPVGSLWSTGLISVHMITTDASITSSTQDTSGPPRFVAPEKELKHILRFVS